jgi:hypothetical protein
MIALKLRLAAFLAGTGALLIASTALADPTAPPPCRIEGEACVTAGPTMNKVGHCKRQPCPMQTPPGMMNMTCLACVEDGTDGGSTDGGSTDGGSKDGASDGAPGSGGGSGSGGSTGSGGGSGGRTTTGTGGASGAGGAPNSNGGGCDCTLAATPTGGLRELATVVLGLATTVMCLRRRAARADRDTNV